MSEGLSKILNILLYVLLGVSALLGVLFYTDAVSADVIIYWCYILFFLGAASAIVLPLINLGKNPSGGKGALIGLIALVVVFVLSYVLAGDEMLPKYENFIDGPEDSKLVGMGLIAFYILAFGAIAAVVYSSISKLIK
jgi:hypothetical protein